MLKKTALVSAVSAAMVLPAQVMAQDINFEFYGSARIQAEAVRPDNKDALDSYTGLRDAYSRIGFNADYALTPGINLVGQLELPLDLANKAVQDPWDQTQDIRVAQIGVEGDFGGLYVGQMWMPYYNAIAFPVDMFSTYYSGFATFTGFRLSDTISYYSPSFNGFSFAGSWSSDKGRNDDNRVQLTGSYSIGDTTLSVGLDDLNGDNNERIYGASVMHSIGEWYFGAKAEYYSSDIDDSSAYGNDGDTAVNLFLSYTLGQHTFKGMLASVDNYGGDVLHLGYDFQYTPSLKLFAELYHEEETAAITAKRAGSDVFPASARGGEVFAVGARYDF